jgi:hypothetical protein
MQCVTDFYDPMIGMRLIFCHLEEPRSCRVRSWLLHTKNHIKKWCAKGILRTLHAGYMLGKNPIFPNGESIVGQVSNLTKCFSNSSL